jgi:phosphoribosylformylglycinamidine cyclo-ligase
VELHWGSWPTPPIFKLIQELGGVSFEEMTRVFNLGLGWVFMVPPDAADAIRTLAPEALPVGRVVAGAGNGPRVRLPGAP